MSDISTYLQQIMQARYGEEVRGAIHDAIEECYDDVSTAKTRAEDAIDAAETATTDAQNAASMATSAAAAAEDAVEDLEAVVASKAVRYDSVQALTDAQKEQARANIEAASADDVDDLKSAVTGPLLDLLRNVAYINDQGQSYYNALYEALYPSEYPRIVATYAPGSHVVYTDDALDTLKPYISVTYYETEESEGSDVSTYTLSGVLVSGNNTITVTYNGYVNTITVVAVDLYNVSTWESTNAIATQTPGTIEGYMDNDVRYTRIRTSQGARTVIGLTRGYVPLPDENGNATNVYPIPMPVGAKDIKVTYTSSGGTSDLAYSVAKLSKADGRYRLASWGSTVSNGTQQTLFIGGANADTFVGLSLFDNTSGAVIVTSWIVEFS